tara:strand:- start:1336 stop:1536 length:201 start_codon:yes stop_codon:yes gene_type:complete
LVPLGLPIGTNHSKRCGRVNSNWSSGATFELRNDTLKKEGGYYSVMDIAEENNKWANLLEKAIGRI